MPSTKPWLAELCLALCVLSLLPLLGLQAIHLWDRPHFQFFPLAWLSFGYFVYSAGKPGWSSNYWRQWFGYSLWGLGIVATIAAAFLYSPWISLAATILCISGWGLLRCASVELFQWLAWTTLLWITLPLPGDLDADLVNGLQRLSAQSASHLLDLIGIMHLRQGTVLEIRSRQLFVDEACSGIDSLYSLIAISLLMIVWQRRPLIVGLYTLATVPLWAWLGNVLRLITIVVLLDRWEIDLSAGWPHTTLGLVTFAISSACLLVTLLGFATLFERFSSSSMPAEHNWHQLYNRAVCFPGKPPDVVLETDQYFAQVPLATDKPPKQPKQPLPSPGWRTVGALAIVCLIAVSLNIRSTWRDWLDGNSVRLPHYELAQVDAACKEADFPESWQGATRMRYEADRRSPESFFGEYSRRWVFRDTCCEFALSLDFPFRGYHPLWVCYTNAGNEVQGSPTSILLPEQSAQDIPYVVQVKLKDDLGNFSYLWFQLFDRAGNGIPVKNYDAPQDSPIWSRMKAVLSDTVVREPVSFQLQLYVPSSRELTKAELDNYTRFFEATVPVAKQLVTNLPE